ncbi:MAG: TetR/AcrR family transcriptional regulator [Lachnospiraceae bacterium]|nr:TetR/AcrR family transcriptional regulator [Lachnospiraceae bacterium]
MPKLQKSFTEVKTDIMEATIAVFNEKGLKFTMDDIAKACHISKKTMYVYFEDKETLFLQMVDYIFDQIKDAESAVLSDDSLSTVEKIKKILCVLPEGYQEIDFTQLYSLREKYNSSYKQVEERLETGWENTIALIEKGMEEGVIRKVNISIVKMMLEASLEQFFQRDILVRNKLSYKDATNEVVNILMEGIISK